MLAGEDTPRVSGKLTFLDNTVDRSTGTITARATVENADKVLLPGQYIKVRLHLTTEPDALLVPQIALGLEPDGPLRLCDRREGHGGAALHRDRRADG